jgi:regulation of enolase protein 1 (concanavalin A-like superfamily)
MKRFFLGLKKTLVTLSLFFLVVFLAVILWHIGTAHASSCLPNWACADVGVPATAGNASVSGGVWTIQAAGSDIGGTADQGFFASTPNASDGAVIARITSQTSAGSINAKAGVVIRQDTSTASAYMGIFATTGNGLQLQYRTTAGGSTTSSTATSAAFLTLPIYVRVERFGTTLRASSSTDGTHWTFYNWSRTITISGTAQTGIMSTSHVPGTLNTAVFDNVSVTDYNDGNCTGWSCTDVGGPVFSGTESNSSGTWASFGEGTDIFGTADQGHFIYNPMPYDGIIQARVTNQDNVNSSAKAGVVIRQDTSAGAAYMGVFVTPGNGLQLQYRTTAGGTTTSTTAIANGALTLPIYVRIVKVGTSFTPQSSTDGVNWTDYSYTKTLTISGTTQAGFLLTSHANNSIGGATFDNFNLTNYYSITGTVFIDNNSSGVQDSGEGGYTGATVALSGTSTASATTNSSGNYSFSSLVAGSYTVTVTLPTGFTATTTNPVNIASLNSSVVENFGLYTPCPTGWNCSDVGSPSVLGAETLTSGSWTIQGSGSDIYNNSDQGHLDTQNLPSDGVVTARIVSQSNTNFSAKAGVVIRQDNSAGSPYMGIFATPGNGLQLQYRTTSGGSTTSQTATTSGFLTLPLYLRIIRQGNYLTPQSSTDGTNWTDYAYAKQITATGTMQAGLMLTSHSSNILGSSTFDNVHVSSRNFCPFGWNCNDIGSIPFAGNSSEDYSTNTFYIQGSGGVNSSNNSDALQFVSQNMQSDGNIQARIVSPSVTAAGLTTGQAGIMIRKDFTASSAYYSMFITPGGSLILQERDTSGNASYTVSSSPSNVSIPTYLKLVRQGSDITSYTSSDGNNWSRVNDSAFNITGSVQVGMFTTSNSAVDSNIAQIDNVNISGGDAALGPYLTVNNQQYMYQGQAIKLYGATIYPSAGVGTPNYSWSDPLFPQRIDYDLNLLQQAHVNLIRATDEENGSTDDPYNPIFWQNMDYLVQQARAKNMFVEMDLSTFGKHLISQSTNPYTASLWTQFINFVTNRYKYAINVSNYSVIGEVNVVGGSFPTSTTQGYLDFFTGTTNQIYNGDQNHLIASGGFSFLNENNNGLPWQQVFSLPHVNMATIHVYPSDPSNPISSSQDLAITVPMVSTWAQQNNKASEIEEYGFEQSLTDASRSAAIQAIQQAATQYGYNGLIIWNIGPQVLGGSNFDENPNYPLAWAQIIGDAPSAFTFPALILNTIPATTQSSNGNSPSSSTWVYPIDAGPHNFNSGFINGTGDASGAITYVGNNASQNDLYISITKVSLSNLIPVPLPWSQGLNTGTDIYQFKAYSSFNGYPVINFDKPVIISLLYDPVKAGKNIKQLRIGYFNTKTKKWNVLSSPTVVDQKNHRISTTTSFYTDFVVVYSGYGAVVSPQPIVLGASTQSNKTPTPTPTPKQITSQFSAPLPSPPAFHKTCILFVCW